MSSRISLTLLLATSLVLVSAHANAVTPPYFEDFESEPSCEGSQVCATCTLSTSGWTNATNDTMDWIVANGPTPSNGTGPFTDHNPGTQAGMYLFTEASSGACQNQTAHLVSPPLDLTNATTPVASFWYHMRGTTMGTLHVDVLDSNQQVLQLDVIASITDNVNQWQQTPTIDLSAYNGTVVHLRMRGITGVDYFSDMAVDDFAFYEVFTNNVALTNIFSPADGTCGLTATDAVVEVTNLGSASQSSIPVQVLVSGSGTATLTGTAVGPLAQFESERVTLSAFNAFAGGSYTLAASTQLSGDENANDDNASTTVNLGATEVTVVAPGVVCSGESATITATPETGVTFGWYDMASAGMQLGTGDSFTTPPITANTTYYVQRESAAESVGPTDNTIGVGGNHTNFDNGLVFDVLQPVFIESFYAYPNSPGDVVVRLLDSNDQVVDTRTVAVNSAGTKTLIPVGFVVMPGTGYQLDAVGTTTGGLFRNTAGAMYPYTSTYVNITGNIPNAQGYYYFFYDWTVGAALCSAERTAVDATVDPSICQVDLEVSIRDDPDPVPPSSSLQLTVSVLNTGIQAAPDADLSLVLPAEFTNAQTTGCAEDPNGASGCTLGAIAAGGTAQVIVDVEVGAVPDGTVTSEAIVATTGNDSDSANNRVTEDTTISSEASGSGGSTSSSGVGGGSSSGAGGASSGSGGNDVAPTTVVDSDCGCELPGGRNDGGRLAWLAGALLGLALLRRRQRETAGDS